MITLITGTPGAGKTLFAVAEFLRNTERPVFCMGITGLQLPHSPLPPVNQWTEHREVPDSPGVMAPFYCYPENSIIVIDEAQNIFRPRASSSRIPDHVAALETHRHTGIDFLLLTQHPRRLDDSVRTLVSRHLHVRRIWGLSRALIYEWDQCSDPGRTSTAIKRTWVYPKKAFALYQSATVHTARGQRPPLLVALVPLGILGAAGAAYAVYDSIHAKTQTPVPAIAAQGAPGRPGVLAPPAPASPAALDLTAAFTPRQAYIPESAPAYDQLRQVRAMPTLAACVATKTRCICYTDQATRLDGIPEPICRQTAERGRFDPYADPMPAAPAARPAPALPAEPSSA